MTQKAVEIDKQSELNRRNEVTESCGESEMDLMKLRKPEWNSVMRIAIG